MKNLFFLFLTMALCNNLIIAQSSDTTNISKVVFYGDAGTTFFYSSLTANLEAKLASSKSEKIHLYGRAGYGILPVGAFICQASTVNGGLFGLTFLTGKGDHHFEANLGVFLEVSRTYKEDTGSSIFSCDEEDGSAVRLPVIEIAYRYQQPGGGFIFRGRIGTLGIGISLGHAF